MSRRRLRVAFGAGALALALSSSACTAAKTPRLAPAAPNPDAAIPSAAVNGPSIRLSAAAKTVEFAILENYDKGQDLEDIEKDFQLFDQLGVHVWRGSFGWDDYEPDRGSYDFEWLDRFVVRAGEHGLTLRPYIGSTPAWAAAGRLYDQAVWNDPPKQIEDWRAFVRALVTSQQKHPHIASYEIYNEANVSMWWDGSAAEYNEVLAAAAAEIRAQAPDKQIVLGGMVWPDDAWVESACEENGNAGAFDVVAFHAYPETWTRPDVRVETYLDEDYRERFLPAVRDCGGKPIWINETGFATLVPDGERGEREQARWWARAIATFVAEPEVRHIGIYEIKDLPTDREAIGDQPSYHLGLAYADRRPKLAFYTVRLLVALLGKQPIEVIDPLTIAGPQAGGARVHARAFLRSDGTRVVLAWSENEAADVDISVPAGEHPGNARAVAYGLDGLATPYADYAGGTLRGVRLEPDGVRIFLLEK